MCLLAETDSEVDLIHYEDADITGSLSWTTQIQEMDPFVLPQHHRGFKEFMGNKTDLGGAMIPAAILAGYTGTNKLLSVSDDEPGFGFPTVCPDPHDC